MDNESRKQHIEQIQKDITSVCMKICFDRKNNKFNEQCGSSCHDSYVKTLQAVHIALQNTARDTNSQLYYKIQVQKDQDMDIIYKGEFPAKTKYYVYDYVNQKHV